MRPVCLFLLFCLLALSACSSLTPGKRSGIARLPGGWTYGSQGSPEVRTALLAQFENWLGTPYRLGGEDRSGIDCSAFVQRTYSDRFNIRLPRSTTKQLDAGQFVPPGEIRIGDLLFFSTGSTGKHVGMYLGQGSFLHASTRNGVILSRLNEAYWQNSLFAVRRILPNS